LKKQGTRAELVSEPGAQTPSITSLPPLKRMPRTKRTRIVDPSKEWEVRAVIGRRTSHGRLEWYTVWNGYPRGLDAWQPRESFIDAGSPEIEATEAWLTFEAAHPGDDEVKPPRLRPRK